MLPVFEKSTQLGAMRNFETWPPSHPLEKTREMRNLRASHFGRMYCKPFRHTSNTSISNITPHFRGAGSGATALSACSLRAGFFQH